MPLFRPMRRGALLALAAVSVLNTACGGSSDDANPTVKTTRYGQVQGADDSARSGTYFWKGVPFAQAPVGALRFAMPKPAEAPTP